MMAIPSIDMEATGLEQKEIVFTLSAALIGYSKELGLTKAILNEIMSDLWKDDEQMKYKTRYHSIVPKGQIGECVDKVDGKILALLIKFENGEVFWFMKRDLIKIEE